MKIGVLALQGDFAEHKAKLQKCGAEVFEIRQKNDVPENFDGLVFPGGESTVIGKLLHELELFDILREKIVGGMPVLATCAGMILLAEKIENDDRAHFGTMHMTVKRNAYGRQLGSFRIMSEVKDIGEIPMTFIRAPYISESSGAEIIAEVDGKAVAAREGNQLALAFHPELDDSDLIFKYWLNMIK